MIKKKILLVALFGILALTLLVLASPSCVGSWVEGDFEFYSVNAGGRPFMPDHYYPGDIYLTPQNQKLHIKEMSYEWEDKGKGKDKGNAGIFLKDHTWDSLFVDNRKYSCIVYDSLTNECQYRLGAMSHWVGQNVDICTFFKGKKLGEEFKYTVTVVYSIDDGPESTQIIEMKVKKVMGKYRATFYRTMAMILAKMFM